MSSRAGFLSSIVVVGLVAAISPARLSAETFDKLTYLTFSGAVQIPGARLNAGTYKFRLANPNDGRNVMQVFSYDGSTVYAMFHTIPDSRSTLTDEATVTFRETPAGVPPAVKSLFYGAEYRGYEFVYPRGGPVLTNDFSAQPEIVYTPSTSAAADSVAVIDSSDNAELAPAPDAVVVEHRDSEVVVEEQPPATELPRTASGLPLVALGGLSSLIVGLGVGLIRRFAN